MDGLLAKRLLFVTGKGGVGKSTVAAALGLVAARRGLRTMIAEVAGQDRVARSLGRGSTGFEEIEIAPGLFHISIDPQQALEEYLRFQIPTRPMADLLASSRMFGYFAAATPGMKELLTMGKVWELSQLQRRTRGAAAYDLTIVDAPATGHGLAILRSPRTFADVARVGPIAHQSRAVQRTIADAGQTGVVAVAHAEEMAVTETLFLRDALREDPKVPLAAVVVNALLEDRFSGPQARSIEKALGTAGTPAARAALRAALSGHTRAGGQREQVERMRKGLGEEPIGLPFLVYEGEPPGRTGRRQDGERAVFEALADALEETTLAAAA
ncbi:MAG: ArsA-related P-loop ATPase [Solirubrobacteraceae bacterium]